ncbi:hypothetical protein [Fimbriiglobus ruber]|uniref:Proline-rich protein n=1 Tax=Fimbriiglobus ruber TaxID=1908690 RepID=A0A225DGJ0_9BACT|nr:hypothetical protein [Fimbriiglobus ruber]OWK36289.1 Proline-rich protein [Fimbriiglobus ruber]
MDTDGAREPVVREDGSSMPDHELRCPQCGTPIPAAADPHDGAVRCPSCGAEIAEIAADAHSPPRDDPPHPALDASPPSLSESPAASDMPLMSLGIESWFQDGERERQESIPVPAGEPSLSALDSLGLEPSPEPRTPPGREEPAPLSTEVPAVAALEQLAPVPSEVPPPSDEPAPEIAALEQFAPVPSEAPPPPPSADEPAPEIAAPTLEEKPALDSAKLLLSGPPDPPPLPDDELQILDTPAESPAALPSGLPPIPSVVGVRPHATEPGNDIPVARPTARRVSSSNDPPLVRPARRAMPVSAAGSAASVTDLPEAVPLAPEPRVARGAPAAPRAPRTEPPAPRSRALTQVPLPPVRDDLPVRPKPRVGTVIVVLFLLFLGFVGGLSVLLVALLVGFKKVSRPQKAENGPPVELRVELRAAPARFVVPASGTERR